MVEGAQPVGVAGVRAGHIGQNLAKGSARAVVIGAPEPPDTDQEENRAAEAGQIAQATPVVTLNAARFRSALRTGCRGAVRSDTQCQPRAGVINLVDESEVVEKSESV